MIYTVADSDLADAVAANISMAATVRHVGMSMQGANYRTIRKRILKLGISTDHWLGLKHGTGGRKTATDLSTVFTITDSPPNMEKIRRLGLVNTFITNVCYECGVATEWNGKPLSLQLDHVNGNRCDNRVENLRMLCPNCHTQTPTWGSKNTKLASRPSTSCSDCGDTISKGSIRCKKCAHVARVGVGSKISWPTNAELFYMIDSTNMSAVSRELKISTNAIKKHIKKSGIR